jgi:hypothetical protein
MDGRAWYMVYEVKGIARINIYGQYTCRKGREGEM